MPDKWTCLLSALSVSLRCGCRSASLQYRPINLQRSNSHTSRGSSTNISRSESRRKYSLCYSVWWSRESAESNLQSTSCALGLDEEFCALSWLLSPMPNYITFLQHKYSGTDRDKLEGQEVHLLALEETTQQIPNGQKWNHNRQSWIWLFQTRKRRRKMGPKTNDSDDNANIDPQLQVFAKPLMDGQVNWGRAIKKTGSCNGADPKETRNEWWLLFHSLRY